MQLRHNRLDPMRLRGTLIRMVAAAYELAMTLLPVWLLLRQSGLPSAILPGWVAAAAVASLAAAALQPLLLTWWIRLAAALVVASVIGWIAGNSLATWTGAALLAVGMLQGSTAPNRSSSTAWPWVGVAIYFAASAASQMRVEWHGLTGLMAILGTACLAVALIFTHERHLRSITLSERAAQRVPPEMRRHIRIYTIMLVLGMLALAAGLGGLALRALRDAVLFVVSIMSALLNFLIPEDVPTSPPVQSPLERLPIAQQEAPSLLSRLLDMLFYAIGFIAFAALLVWGLSRLYRSRRELWSRLTAFLKAILRIKPPTRQQHNGYIDEETSLFSWEESLARLRRNRIGRMLLRRREPGYDDMPNNREKVRFLYRSWLRKLVSRGFKAQPHLTPAETLHAAASEASNKQPPLDLQRASDLIDLYYQVRYHVIEPTDEQVTRIRHLDNNKEP